MPAFLVDTNVLVYAVDPADRVKQERAALVLRDLGYSRQGRLSVQCLTEFFNASTKRLRPPLSVQEARMHVERMATSYPVLAVTRESALQAVRVVHEHGLSIWDGLIWAVAKDNGIPTVLTADQEHGRQIEGVLYLNPFHADFDLGLLVAR